MSKFFNVTFKQQICWKGHWAEKKEEEEEEEKNWGR
jgi:hypothetical protein